MRMSSVSCLFILLTAMPAVAGVVYEIEVKNHAGYAGQPSVENIKAKVDGNRIAIGGGGSDGQSDDEMIFRGDRREMIAISHKEQAYFVVDEAALQKLGGQLSEMEAQFQEMLKDVPADQRPMVEAMMKQKMPQQMQAPAKSVTEVRRTSERATHNGYPFVKYEVYRDGRKLRELWVTDWGNVEGGEEVIGAFEDMSEFFEDLRSAIPRFGEGDDENPFEHMKELDGFPVLTREFADDGSLEGESLLRSSQRQTIDPDAFEPPSGYKRQEMFGG